MKAMRLLPFAVVSLRFQSLFKARRIFRTRICLGLFGGESEKPVHLFCIFEFIAELESMGVRASFPRNCGLVEVDFHRDGSRRSVTGSAQLKESQTYPLLFGAKVALLYHQRREESVSLAMALLEDARSCMLTPHDFATEPGIDLWLDACLDESFELAISMLPE